ncbi:tRNA-ribosyltransferase [Methanoculleus sp. FWC-SCC1]|uniref:tRNA-ribosyltransferase n=1 Tax=Methanoculleus frigidifontis TaxID=2584085 RepID=A0ABT8M6B7_9EURY|nr:DUF5591 domain-containing protein [Methanoculleus sp. FWC-SCC1]MDN7023451.1 tRNA-ribosyltransferase [Methanoculleus sp. FWC-SCC1]
MDRRSAVRVTGVVTDRHGNEIEIFDPPFYRAEFEAAYRYIIDEYRVEARDVGIFIPCAVRKPYSQSPSHKLFRRIIDEVLSPEEYHIVIFGTCGTVPAELELMYPFRHYHYMLGRVADERVRRDFHRIEVYRLCGYLEKTRFTYKQRLAYCIGPFRKAMAEASAATGIPVDLLPSDPMIGRMYDIDCPFPEGSLSMQAYIDEFRAGIARLARTRPKPAVRVEEASRVTV